MPRYKASVNSTGPQKSQKGCDLRVEAGADAGEEPEGDSLLWMRRRAEGQATETQMKRLGTQDRPDGAGLLA